MSDGKIYESPKTDDKTNNYWVPIVIKNKDVLVGYVEAVTVCNDIYEINPGELMNQLCSERFNDIMRNGKRLGDMTLTEKYDYFRDIISQKISRNSHDENGGDILSKYAIGVSCTCGNFYGFDELEDLPEENLKCQVCDKTIIHYTFHEDGDYLYDGKAQEEEELTAIIETIHEELGIETEFGPEDDEEEGGII